jgi:ribonuclease E
MLDEESTDTTTQTASTDEQPPAAPRRRRAAARAAGPPLKAAGDQTVKSDIEETVKEATAPTRARRTRKRAAAPPDAPPDALPDVIEETVKEATAPTRARRTRKRAAAPPDALPDVVAEVPSRAPQEAPAPASGEEKPKRSRRTRKKTEVQVEVEETVAPPTVDGPVVTEVVADQPAAEAPAVEVPVDEPVEEELADTADGAVSQSPPPALAFRPPIVLFQPPAPPAERDEAIADGRAEPAEGDDSEEPGDEEAEGGLDDDSQIRRRRRRRGGRGRRPKGADDLEGQDDEAEPAGETSQADEDSGSAEDAPADESDEAGTRRRRRRRRRGAAEGDADEPRPDDPPNTVVRVREPRAPAESDDVQSLKGSTRLEAKRQRRREGREQGRRRVPIITEAEFLARRESVERVMVVREAGERTQIAVLEDGVLVEHYIDQRTATSYVGNVYLGKVQNVLASMEAAFVDIGKGRNAVLYAGEVNWDAAGLEGQPKRIEEALKSGQSVLVQVTKDPMGHKGARLTSQISLPGRYLVYVPDGSMTGISRKLPDRERTRLKSVLRKVLPEGAGVIVRTAAEGASEEELAHDVARLQAQWESIQAKARTASAPALLYGEPDLTIRVIRDIFNEDFGRLVVAGAGAAETVEQYVGHVAPDLMPRVERWREPGDVFAAYRVDEQLLKGLDRKVWLPSGGSLVIDRTEAMTVVDVNTGKFTGKGGNLEETVTKNNLEAAEEIVRQLRLRDIGGIIVIDFIDMVLESNRELVLRRLLECLGRDRTRHQVAEVTSLGLVQMTRKRVGQGLLEAFSHTCDKCGGRGLIVQMEPVEAAAPAEASGPRPSRRRRGRGAEPDLAADAGEGDDEATDEATVSAEEFEDVRPEPDEPGTLAETLEPEVEPLSDDAEADEEAEPKRPRRARKRAQPVA